MSQVATWWSKGIGNKGLMSVIVAVFVVVAVGSIVVARMRASEKAAVFAECDRCLSRVDTECARRALAQLDATDPRTEILGLDLRAVTEGFNDGSHARLRAMVDTLAPTSEGYSEAQLALGDLEFARGARDEARRRWQAATGGRAAELTSPRLQRLQAQLDDEKRRADADDAAKNEADKLAGEAREARERETVKQGDEMLDTVLARLRTDFDSAVKATDDLRTTSEVMIRVQIVAAQTSVFRGETRTRFDAATTALQRAAFMNDQIRNLDEWLRNRNANAEPIRRQRADLEKARNDHLELAEEQFAMALKFARQVPVEAAAQPTVYIDPGRRP